MRRVLRLEFTADVAQAALVGPAVRGVAEAAGFDRSRAAEVALCAQEAAVNAVEHALEGKPEAIVSVTLSIAEDLLEVEVRDAGRPMPAGLLDEARRSEPDPLAERGRGLFMITRLAGAVSYRTDAAGNVLRMEFRTPATAG